MIRATAYQLIADCLTWADNFGDDPKAPDRFREMSAAMCRVARYIRTGV